MAAESRADGAGSSRQWQENAAVRELAARPPPLGGQTGFTTLSRVYFRFIAPERQRGDGCCGVTTEYVKL